MKGIRDFAKREYGGDLRIILFGILGKKERFRLDIPVNIA